MLELKATLEYGVPRYPQGVYHTRPNRLPIAAIRRGASAVIAAALLDWCVIGCMGAMPPQQRLKTENEARASICKVFEKRGIELTPDYLLRLATSEKDTVALTVDGYNPESRVGYEYVRGRDELEFTDKAKQALVDAAKGEGPWVKTIDASDGANMCGWSLEAEIEAFIDSLKAQGVI